MYNTGFPYPRRQSDDDGENCAQELLRNLDSDPNHVRLRFGPDQISSRRPRGARRSAGAGTPLKGLTADDTAFFLGGQARFAEPQHANGVWNTLFPLAFGEGAIMLWPLIKGAKPLPLSATSSTAAA